LVVDEVFDTVFEFVEENIVCVDDLVVGTNDNGLF